MDYVNEMRKHTWLDLRCDLKECQLLHAKGDSRRALFISERALARFHAKYDEAALTCAATGVTSVTLERKRAALVAHYMRALDMHSQLLNETKSQTPTLIIREYLAKAVSLIDADRAASRQGVLRANAYYSLAKFADMQHATLCSYMASTSFKQHAHLVDTLRAEKERAQLVDPHSHFNWLLDKQLHMAQKEAHSVLDDRHAFLLQSVGMYLAFLELGPRHDDEQRLDECVFRFVALWTENSDDAPLNAVVKDKLGRVSSHLFHKLIYQLTARISIGHATHLSLFQSTLIELALDFAVRQPHHMLPILLAFANSHKDLVYNRKAAAAAATTTPSSSNNKESGDLAKYLLTQDRVQTAVYLIERVRTSSTHMREVVESYGRVCDAYIELANYRLSSSEQRKQKQTRTHALDKSLLIAKMNNNMQHVSVFTLSQPIACGTNLQVCIFIERKNLRNYLKKTKY